MLILHIYRVEENKKISLYIVWSIRHKKTRNVFVETWEANMNFQQIVKLRFISRFGEGQEGHKLQTKKNLENHLSMKIMHKSKLVCLLFSLPLRLSYLTCPAYLLFNIWRVWYPYVRRLRPEPTEWLCCAPGKCWLWRAKWPELRRIETSAAWRQAQHRCSEAVRRHNTLMANKISPSLRGRQCSGTDVGRGNDSVDCCGKMTATASQRRRLETGGGDWQWS